MAAITARLTRLERAQQPQDAPQWTMAEFRPSGDGVLWQDESTGAVGTKDELSAQYGPNTVLVFLDSLTRILYRG